MSMIKASKAVFKNKIWWGLFFCLLLCAFIWWVGPAISIYSSSPLQSVALRLLLIASMLLLLVLMRYRVACSHAVASFFNVHAKLEWPRFHPGYRLEKRQMRRDFKKLKAQRSYDLPWYLVMGEQGAGKTSLLREAELNLSYQSYNHIRHHTKSFQWVLAEEGLFMDVPAALCWQREEAQRFSWLMFLKYLKKARSRRPINGLILTINLRDWLDQKLDDWLESMRLRLHELQDKVGLSIPVYLVFTHIDVLPGFAEFVLRFSEEERHSILGLTFAESSPALAQLPLAYDALIRALNQRMRRDLDQSASYYFPMQMAALREKLLGLGQFLFHPRKNFMPTRWRGLYFVSNGGLGAEQYDVILGEACLSNLAWPRALRNRRFFSEEMFKQAILPEAELVGVQAGSEWRFSLWQALKLGGLLLATLGAVGVWTGNMVQHLNQNNRLEAVTSATDLSTLAQWYHAGLNIWPTGLYVYQNPQTALASLYQQQLQKQFLPQLITTLQTGLAAATATANNNNMNSIENVYNWLSCTLMLNQLNQLNPGQMQALLDNKASLQFSQNLADLLQLGFSPVTTLDQNIIQKARAAMWNSPLYMQAYLRLKLEAASQNQQNFQLAGAMSADSAEVFSNLNAVSVPYLFSKAGYAQFYAAQANQSLTTVADQSWVLGDQYHAQNPPPDLAAARAQMDNLYWTDYMNAWDSALAQLNMAQFTSLQQEIDLLTTLTEKDSPLISVVMVVTDNSSAGLINNNLVATHYLPLTALLTQSQGAGMQGVLASLTALQQYLNSLANSSNPQLSAYTAATQIFAGQADHSLTAITSEAQTLPMPLSRWLNQIVANTYAIIFATANQYLADQWQAGVVSYYQQTLDGRFPFADSENEVTLQDFSNYFKPGGVEDSFVKKYLSPFLTYDSFGQAQWASVDNLPFSADAAIPREITAATVIRNTFFGGNNGALNFTITPAAIDNAHRAVLNYDGKAVVFDGDSDPGINMVWPPQNTDGSINISFDRLLMPDEVKNFMGPWALFHLLQASTLVRSKYSSQYQVEISQDGMAIHFSLSANSVNNPFDLRLLRDYTLPRNF